MSTFYYSLKQYTRTLCVLAFLFIVQGCGTIGPKKLPGDQFNFNAAINESSSEQLLLNLVRLRYSEQPTFLKVASIVNQYTRSGSTNVLGGTNDAILGANIAGGGGVSWSNTPTITYLPISGQEFSRNLLTPLPPSALLGLIQSGWPIELVMKTTIWSVNGIFDEVARPSGRRFADPRLYELGNIWQYLTDNGLMGLKKVAEDSDTVEVFFQKTGTEDAMVKISRFKELLDLDDESDSYIIKYGLIPESKQEIAMITGSIWEIMLNLAWYFNVPPSHIADGRTMEGLAAKDDAILPPINVLHSEEEPQTNIKVFTQDYWFYLDDNDRNSKRYFSFLQLILNLSENQTAGQGPALTIPTN